MKLILLGPPGSGKGTQATLITQTYLIPKIATGDMLRAAVQKQSPLGVKAQTVMLAGELVSDNLIIDLINERLTEADCAHGFLFDGFPRTLDQAQAIRDGRINVGHLDAVIRLDVPDEEIIGRLTGRTIHPASGRTYHAAFAPPKVPGLDDATGEPLVQRPDDQEETVRKRLEVYHQETRPVADYFSAWQASGDQTAPPYFVVNGSRDPQVIESDIMEILKGVCHE
jgi:adenylate kinase